jgi:hypothetical protein
LASSSPFTGTIAVVFKLSDAASKADQASG